MMKKFVHPNILSAISYKQDTVVFPGGPHDLLMLEYAERGTLLDLIKK